jgi:hypothetical protein
MNSGPVCGLTVAERSSPTAKRALVSKMAERLARLQELLAMLQAANEVASATESGDVSRLLADLDVMSAGGLAHPPLDTADRGARVATGHRLLLNHRRHP